MTATFPDRGRMNPRPDVRDADRNWNILFLGADISRLQQCVNALAGFRYRGRAIAALQAGSDDEVRRLCGLSDLAAVVIDHPRAPEFIRCLRDEAGNWEASLVLVDGVGEAGAGLAVMPDQNQLILSRKNLVPGKFSAHLENALAIHERNVAIRHISLGAAALTSAGTLEKFAGRSLDLLDRIPEMPPHRLFCVRDNESRLEFVIAGSGRFTGTMAGPLTEFGEDSVKLRIAPDATIARPAAEDHWQLWEIPTTSRESILIYLENISPVPFRIDARLRTLFCNQLTATFGHLGDLEKIKRAHRAAVFAMADLAEFRDTDTGEHVVRVANITDEITWVLREHGCFPGEITDDFVEQLGAASSLHDVGKVAVPDRVLLKPGKLDPDEWELIKNHTLQGAAILARAGRMAQESRYFSMAAEVAENHHEHYDGGGYPRGLRGEDIPLAARIVAVVDVFDALAGKRPYKEAWSNQDAIAYIRERAGSQFDPIVVGAFLTVIERRSEVTLTQWGSAMSVGDPMLDQDHSRLIGLINQLETAQVTGNRNVVAPVLDELLFYAVDHFQREERHMEAMGYPRLEVHRRIHQRFIDTTGKLNWQYQRGLRRHLTEELLEFLSTWLIDHIMKEDQRYQRFRLEAAEADSVQSLYAVQS